MGCVGICRRRLWRRRQRAAVDFAVDVARESLKHDDLRRYRVGREHAGASGSDGASVDGCWGHVGDEALSRRLADDNAASGAGAGAGAGSLLDLAELDPEASELDLQEASGRIHGWLLLLAGEEAPDLEVSAPEEFELATFAPPREVAGGIEAAQARVEDESERRLRGGAEVAERQEGTTEEQLPWLTDARQAPCRVEEVSQSCEQQFLQPPK